MLALRLLHRLPKTKALLKVGITGGIGSGKSTVAKIFSILGVPIFRADDAAKLVMENNAEVISAIKALFGSDVFEHGKLIKGVISAQIFSDASLLAKMNAIVHPATIQYGQDWLLQQRAPYVIKEAAIFFESGSNKEMDIMIGVSAPEALRIQRVIGRGSDRATIMRILASQMNDNEKMALCDMVIKNDDIAAVIPQVYQVHQILLKRAA